MTASMNWGEELATTYNRYGRRIGIVDHEGSHSVASIVERASGIAAHLLTLGVSSGDYVATIFHNSALAASASYAVSLLGAAEVPINPLLSEKELQHALRCAHVKIVLADGADPKPPVGSIRLEDIRPVTSGQLNPSLWADVAPEAPSRIVFTSGTTGAAKGAIHSHQGRWTANLLLRAALPFLPDRSNRILLMTPFSHGSSLLTFAYLAEGASVHLLRGVDPAIVLPLIAASSLTEIFAPPTVLAKLSDASEKAPEIGVNGKLRTILTGTAPLAPRLYAMAVKQFGEIVRVTYGKSEIFNPITVLDPGETAQAYSEPAQPGLCVGWPAPGVRIQIRDDDGSPVTPGETGHIFLHSPHLSLGYMTSDGDKLLASGEFHETGDLGWIDRKGRLFLCSRQSDMMKTGGYKVSPDEVERALSGALPSIDFVVLGFPSEYWGEVITVVARKPPKEWEKQLEPAVAEMTAYKRPRLFVETNELPVNSIGKISRALLRQWLKDNFNLVEKPRPSLVRKSDVAGVQR